MITTESTVPEEAIRLREYLGVLLRRKWSIITVVLLAVLGSLFYAQQQTPTYTSTASVQATNVLPVQVAGGANLGPNMDTEQQLVASDSVSKCAFLILQESTFLADPAGPFTLDLSKVCSNDAVAGVDPVALRELQKHLSVTFPQTASVLQITFSDKSPKRAQASAEAYAWAYIQYKTVTANALLDQQRQPFEEQLTDAEKELTSVDKQISDVLADLATSTEPDPSLSAQLQDLEAQRNDLENTINNLNTSLLNLDPSKITPPQLLLPAALPKKPSSPNKILDGVLGLFIGVAFGIGLAILRERLDESIRGRRDLEEQLGVPVLAVIPKVPGWRKRQEPKLVTLDQPKSAVSEAYRTLRTSIVFTSVQRGVKTIMVVSPTAGEGKTTTAANVAVSLANANKRVILVSADLRKPRVHRFFDMENSVGLSNVLSGEVRPWEALQDPKVENLRLMSSGPVPARPAELLQSEQLGDLLVELREVADFVVIDTAPILLVADALVLAPLVDSVLFVADAEVSTRGSVAHAREQLEQVGAPILGAIYNNFDPSKGRMYYPYSGYYGPYYRYRYRYGRYGGYESYYGAPQRNGEAAEGETRPLPPAEIPPERQS